MTQVVRWRMKNLAHTKNDVMNNQPTGQHSTEVIRVALNVNINTPDKCRIQAASLSTFLNLRYIIPLPRANLPPCNLLHFTSNILRTQKFRH